MMQTLELQGEQYLRRPRASLHIDAQGIRFKCGEKQIEVLRADFKYATLWLVSHPKDGQSELILHREDGTALAAIPLGDFPEINDIASKLGDVLPIRHVSTL